MVNSNKYMSSSSVPSCQFVTRTVQIINANLIEMDIIVAQISREKELPGKNKQRQLLYFGSLCFDYYLLAEDCLLQLAKTIDQWIPSSLDWRRRLIMLMQNPVPGKRPPVISSETAKLLDPHLTQFLNFHLHSITLSEVRIIGVISTTDRLNILMHKDFSRAKNLLGRQQQPQ